MGTLESQNVATPASQWKGRIKVEGSPLDLPSGNTALVRQISPQAFVQSGLIPDPLSAIIRQAINNKRGLPPKTLENMAKDQKQLSAAMEMFDRVLAYVVVEPAVEMPPTCSVVVDGEQCGLYANQEVHQNPTKSGSHRYQEGPRNPDVLYTDMVEMDDKMFIFNWCLGGTRDVAKFRGEQQRVMESVSHGQGVRGEAEQPA